MSFQIPESDKLHNDIYDLIADGNTEIINVVGQDGQIHKQQVLNTKRAYYSTRLVNYKSFSRFVFELENLENMALQCFNNMPFERASVLHDQIMSLVNAFRYSIDGKSSEIMGDNDNTQQNLIHILTRNKMERIYSMKDDAKEGFFAGLGMDRNKDRQG